MTRTNLPPTIIAIRRNDPDDADHLFAAIGAWAHLEKLSVIGVMQRNLPRPGRAKCDMDLVDLETGRAIRISEDRGDLARGCRMDMDAIATVAALLETRIEGSPVDLLMINKFGKAEEEGGGMRNAMALAIDRGVPVIVSVGSLSEPALVDYAGSLVVLVEPDARAVGRILSEWFPDRVPFDQSDFQRPPASDDFHRAAC